MITNFTGYENVISAIVNIPFKSVYLMMPWIISHLLWFGHYSVHTLPLKEWSI